MKMQAGLYNDLKAGIKAVIDHHTLGVIQGQLTSGTIDKPKLTKVMWALMNAALFDYEQPDTHPAYQQGRVRLLPYKGFGWTVYQAGLNDSHIRTALKQIGKELDITSWTS